jgi:biofilm PGA synthesis lipoprotein PgaB
VLAEVGYTAATFLITGHVGASPAYLTWAEAKALAKTGRWDVEAHTHDQHHFVQTGPRSRPASALINRIWDPARGSLESSDSARTRVETDLTHSLDLLSSKGFARPTAFAYPFSQVAEPSNDASLPAQVSGLLHATFPLLLSNSRLGRMAQPDDVRLGFLPRIEVHSRMTALNLFDRIRTSDIVVGSEHSTGERSGG